MHSSLFKSVKFPHFHSTLKHHLCDLLQIDCHTKVDQSVVKKCSSVIRSIVDETDNAKTLEWSFTTERPNCLFFFHRLLTFHFYASKGAYYGFQEPSFVASRGFASPPRVSAVTSAELCFICRPTLGGEGEGCSFISSSLNRSPLRKFAAPGSPAITVAHSRFERFLPGLICMPYLD